MKRIVEERKSLSPNRSKIHIDSEAPSFLLGNNSEFSQANISFGNISDREHRVSEVLSMLANSTIDKEQTRSIIIEALKTQIEIISRINDSFASSSGVMPSNIDSTVLNSQIPHDLKVETDLASYILSSLARYCIMQTEPLKEVQLLSEELDKYFQDRSEDEYSTYKICFFNSLLFSMNFATHHSFLELLECVSENELGLHDEIDIDPAVQNAHLEHAVVFGFLDKKAPNYTIDQFEQLLKSQNNDKLVTLYIKASKTASEIAPNHYAAFAKLHYKEYIPVINAKINGYEKDCSFGDIALLLYENRQLAQGMLGNAELLEKQQTLYGIVAGAKTFKDDVLHSFITIPKEQFFQVIGELSTKNAEFLTFARNVAGIGEGGNQNLSVSKAEIDNTLHSILFPKPLEAMPVYHYYPKGELDTPFMSKGVEDDFELLEAVSPAKMHEHKTFASVSSSIATSKYREVVSQYKAAIKLMQEHTGNMLFPVKYEIKTIADVLKSQQGDSSVYYSASDQISQEQQHLIGDTIEIEYQQ